DFLSRAAHVPDARADMYRGSAEPWTPEAARRDLRGGAWYEHVLSRVRELDPSVEGWPSS
ncbi:hypothetical protein E4U41_004616, partial [Claviceps citrina]